MEAFTISLDQEEKLLVSTLDNDQKVGFYADKIRKAISELNDRGDFSYDHYSELSDDDLYFILLESEED